MRTPPPAELPWMKVVDVRQPGLYLLGHVDGGQLLRLVEIAVEDGTAYAARAIAVFGASPPGYPEGYRFWGPIPPPCDDRSDGRARKIAMSAP